MRNKQYKPDDVTIRKISVNILASGYPDSKFTICFSPTVETMLLVGILSCTISSLYKVLLLILFLVTFCTYMSDCKIK